MFCQTMFPTHLNSNNTPEVWQYSYTEENLLQQVDNNNKEKEEGVEYVV